MPGFYSVSSAVTSSSSKTAACLPRRLTFVPSKHSKPLPLALRKVSACQPNCLSVSTKELLPCIELEWSRTFSIGPGLVNAGNTCFLNSVLQCLTHTSPLVNFLLQKQHSKICRSNAFCLWCVMERHIQQSVNRSIKVVQPRHLLKHLRLLGRGFRLGRQEDAHEFLRKMQETLQRHEGVPDSNAREVKGVSGAIFGGRFRSQVQCMSCRHNSNTYELFMDVQLDLPAKSISQALSRFTRPESLRAPNLYRCEQCKGLVEAKKRLTIEQAPAVLTVQLKRFTPFGDKLNQSVQFDEHLDLDHHMSERNGDNSYNLYGIVVHYGHSLHSGHYVAYVRSPAGPWYKMDDESVTRASFASVTQQRPYLLFYIRNSDSRPSSPEPVLSRRNPELAPPSSLLNVEASHSVTSRPPVVQKKKNPFDAVAAAARPILQEAELVDIGYSSKSSCTRAPKNRFAFNRHRPLKRAKLKHRGTVSLYFSRQLPSLKSRELEAWQGLDAQQLSERTRAVQFRTETSNLMSDRRDEYDQDYDRGRLKKRRNKQPLQQDTEVEITRANVFQRAHNQRQQQQQY